MFRQQIERVPLFTGLSSAELDVLAPLFEEVCLTPGQVLFEQGQVADFFYILLEGEVMVNYKPYDGPVLNVSRVLSGGIFGWSSALGRSIFTSSAVAVTGSTVIRIRGEELRCLCEEYPQTGVLILERLAAAIAARLQNNQEQVFNLIMTGLAGANCPRSKRNE